MFIKSIYIKFLKRVDIKMDKMIEASQECWNSYAEDELDEFEELDDSDEQKLKLEEIKYQIVTNLNLKAYWGDIKECPIKNNHLTTFFKDIEVNNSMIVLIY